MTWDWEFVRQILPKLFAGAWYTVWVTLASSTIALLGGLLLAILEYGSNEAGRKFIRFWLELARGVPTLVLLYTSFYILPSIGIILPAMPIGIGTLGIVYAAYCSEVYRGNLITIPSQLRDACVALSLSRRVTWQRVLIPLVVRQSAPALLNYVLSLFRETTLLFALGIPVLMGEASIVADQSFRYLEPFTLAGLIYTIMNLPFLFVIYRVKRKHA